MPFFADLRPLPDPAPVRHLAFADFDETYLAHAGGDAHRELEEFLVHAAGARNLMFGWVTGSSAAAVADRASRRGLTVVPHFVASSLATDLLVLDQGELRPDGRWAERIRASGYRTATVRRLVETLARQGVALTRQPGSGATPYIENFYLRDERAAAVVRALAAEFRIGVNVSRCNPGAGDPAGTFDVDFFPPGCGKAEVVRELCERYGVPAVRTYAFGDSEGDLEMLRVVGHGYLVGNCTAEARAAFPRVCEASYATGILQVLRHIGEQ